MSDFGLSRLTGGRILDLRFIEGILAIDSLLRVRLALRAAAKRRQVYIRSRLLEPTGCTILREDLGNLRSLALGLFDGVLCAGFYITWMPRDTINVFIRF